MTGFGQVRDLALEVEDVEVMGAFVVLIAAVVTPHLLVAAGAEGQITGPGEDDDADAGIEAGIVQRLHHLLHRQRPEGVAHLRTIDGDLGDPLFGLVVADVLKVAAAVVPERRGVPLVQLFLRWLDHEVVSCESGEARVGQRCCSQGTSTATTSSGLVRCRLWPADVMRAPSSVGQAANSSVARLANF